MIKEGDRLCLVSFGAGLTWASAIVQWGQPIREEAHQDTAQDALIWDLNALRQKMSRASTSLRVKARTFVEEMFYKANTLLQRER